MIIKTLVENTSISKDLGSEHGFSLYIETNAHKILFDVGASELFIENAKKLNVNFLEHFHDLKGQMPDYVIGGFHLSSPSSGSNENLEMIDKISRCLLDTNVKCYTCHCTGIEPYNRLKAVMGDSIDYLSAGSEITI